MLNDVKVVCFLFCSKKISYFEPRYASIFSAGDSCAADRRGAREAADVQLLLDLRDKQQALTVDSRIANESTGCPGFVALRGVGQT